jgi:hypothetical protein
MVNKAGILKVGPCTLSEVEQESLLGDGVKKLRLSTIRFRGNAYPGLMRLVAQSTLLTELRMDGCGGSVGRDPVSFGKMLAQVSSLRSIGLTDCELTAAGATEIARGLRENTRITALDLSSNPLDVGLGKIADALMERPRPMAELYLEQITPSEDRTDLRPYSDEIREINGRVVDALMACNGATGCLKHLSLGCYAEYFSDDATPRLENLLQQSVGLETLRLNCAIIGRSVIRDTLAGLSSLTSLTMLPQYAAGYPFQIVGNRSEVLALTFIVRYNPSIRQIRMASMFSGHDMRDFW